MSDSAVEPTSPCPPRSRFAGAGWLALMLIALVEVAGHAVVQSRVATEDDWEAAARHVREQYAARDLVAGAPFWADPILRQHLGDVISMADAGNHDLAPYDRLWVLSIRGHRAPEEPARQPDELVHFGAITVSRWDLGPSPVVYDFVARLGEAQVSMVEGGTEQSCPLRRVTPRGGSGLDQGPLQPADRFVCDPRRPWLWVGASAMQDLDLRPRYCIWNHPLGAEPVRVTYRAVPLGSHLVLHGGLAWVQERWRRGGPTRIVVRVDGEAIGELTHRDGDGFKRMVALTRPDGAGPTTGDVTFEVTAPEPHHRTFCWSATIREGARAEER